MDVMVYSPHPPCGAGYPSCGFVVFQLCVRAREEGEPAPPAPPWNRMVFPFAIRTHTHTPCLCEWMAILSPNPPPVEQDGFETHTHTGFTQYCLETLSLLWKLRLSQGASRAGQAGYDTGCGTPAAGAPRPRGFRPLYLGGGGYYWGGGGGRERTAHNHIYI